MAKAEAKKKSGLLGKKKTKTATTDTKRVAGPNTYQILIEPVITEKSSLAGSQSNGVVFIVDPRASKDQIKDAVQSIFKVEVRAIQTVNMQGKVKRTRGSVGRRAGFKKAYVSLKEGQTIDIVEGI
jgi:large subunit ribosomal protein L23